MSSERPAPSPLGAFAARWSMPIAGAAGLLVLMAIFSQPGVELVGAGLATALQITFEAGFVPALWLLGALGLGHLAMSVLVRTDRVSWSMALALGVALMLFLAHAGGVLGLFGGASGRLVAWIPTSLGLAAIGAGLWRSSDRDEHWSLGARLPAVTLAALPGIALLLVAACAPPGTLWRSEALGFDVLSYHLQLPREWMELGRIEPLEHNVYSFLPSYVEAAYTQLGVMMHGRRDITAGAGLPVYAAQLLHVLLAITSSILIGRLTLSICDPSVDHVSEQAAFDPAIRRRALIAGGFAAVVVLLTPWVIVAGSLAYNEMAVLVCFAGALLVSLQRSIGALTRGLLVGALLGVACSAKLTSAYMVVPAAVVILLASAPLRQWPRLVVGGIIAGALAMAPWLIRNELAAGNPVFPLAADLLGRGDWTPEQVQRFLGAHMIHASLNDRIALLLSSRGLLHTQWSLLWVVVPIGALVALRNLATRRAAAVMLLALFVQLAAWMSIGHLQSRFLLPAIVPGAVLLGLGLCATLMSPSRRVRFAGCAASGAVLVALAVHSATIFLHENDGRPNIGLVGGVAQLTGDLARTALSAMPPRDREQLLGALPPAALANVVIEPSRQRLYLLGDSTPLYFRVPVLYHTTWDTSPLGELLRQQHGDLDAAVRLLQEQFGVTHVLVNLDELDRLGVRDHWYDPDMTPDRAIKLLETQMTIIRAWTPPGSAGTYLGELSGADGTPR